MEADAGPSRRTVLLHGAVYTASRIANQAAAFLLLPVYAHYLGGEGMGVVEVMTVARSFLYFLFMQGLDAAWFRLRFDFEDAESRRRFESSVVWYLLASSSVGIALLWALGDRVGAVLTPGVAFVPLGLWSAVTAMALAFILLLERRLQAERRPWAFASFTLARTLGTTAVVIVFVVGLHRGAEGKVVGEALAVAVAAVFALMVIRPRLVVSGPDVRRALAYGWPLVPHGFAGLANDLIDRFFLNALLGLGAVGVYSIGYRVAGLGMMVVVAVNQAFAPVFIETLRSAERADAEGRSADAASLRNRIASVGFLTLLAGCALAQAVTATAREVLLVATTPEFSESWRVVAPVSLGVVAWSWYATLSQSVAYRPSTVRLLPIITVAAAVTNVAANYFLIPRMGMMGAAWATLLSNGTMGALGWKFGMRSLPLPYAFPRWIGVTVWTAVSLAVFWALDAWLEGVAVRLAAKTAWLAASLGVTLVLSGMRPAALLELWKRRK